MADKGLNYSVSQKKSDISAGHAYDWIRHTVRQKLCLEMLCLMRVTERA
jgi:hypothetical protein